MENEHIEETGLEQLILKVTQNYQDIKQAELILNNIKLWNIRVKNILLQLNKQNYCEHEWLGLYGHPAVFECQKCGKLEKAV